MARFKTRLAATEYNMKKLKQGLRDEKLPALGVTDSPSEDRLGKDWGFMIGQRNLYHSPHYIYYRTYILIL
jgi:hypothetical protein